MAFSDKAEQQKKSYSNIIIILTDDQGYGDVGFNGCEDIPTPNIDQIAKNGVVFSQAYVTYAVCAPSRAGLLTGRYQDRFGYSRNPLFKPNDPNQGLSLQEQMLPAFLKQFGYTSMAIGKWHLGAHSDYRPLKRGFDHFFGFLGGGHQYFPRDLTIYSEDSVSNEGDSYRTKLTRDGHVVEEDEYLTDAFSREAVSFIQNNKKKPFFLYLAYNAPHTPMQASEKYFQRFSHIQAPKRKTYAAMVSAVDDGVGRILKALEDLKLSENTLVIFLSDNGGPKQDNASDNGKLRGGKGSFFEGGIRVPFAMQWPNHIQAGTRFDKPISSLDIFATISNHLNGDKLLKNPLDGVDLLPHLTGKKTDPPHEYLFWRQYDQKRYAVLAQTGVKEVSIQDSLIHSFNLKSDISESNDFSILSKNKSGQFEQKKKEWESQMIPPSIWGLYQEKQYQFGKKPD